MSFEQAILEAVRALPPEQQQEVLAHARRLRPSSRRPRRSGKGLWDGLDISLSADDLDQARREIWRPIADAAR